MRPLVALLAEKGDRWSHCRQGGALLSALVVLPPMLVWADRWNLVFRTAEAPSPAPVTAPRLELTPQVAR